MPGTTPNYGFPYPNADGSDPIVPDDIRVPLLNIDNALKAVDNRVKAFDQNTPVDIDVETIDPEWTLNFCRIYAFGKLRFMYFSITKKTPAIASSVSGNIANNSVMTIATGHRPLIDAVGTVGGGNGIAGTVFIQSTGILYLGTIAPGQGVAIGDDLTGSIMWITA